MAWVGRLSLSLMLLADLATAAAAEPKRVLLLHSFGPQFVPWVFFSGQFREALIKHSPDKIDLYEASLESARFQQPEEQGPIIDYLRSLFAERKLDLIVAMGAPATFFVQRYRTQFFQETPMIIAASEQRAFNASLLTANDAFVGVALDFGAAELVDLRWDQVELGRATPACMTGAASAKARVVLRVHIGAWGTIYPRGLRQDSCEGWRRGQV